jgi:hypothetical protein
MNNTVAKRFQKIPCKMPVIKPKKHPRAIASFKANKMLGYITKL